MSNDLRFNISVSTEDARKQLNNLTRDAENLSKKIEDVGKRASDMGKGSNHMGRGLGESTNIDDAGGDSRGIFSTISSSLKHVTEQLLALNKTLRESRSTGQKTPHTPSTSPSTGGEKRASHSTPSPHPKKTNLSETISENQYQQLLQLGTLSVAAKRYFGEGARQSRELESSALQIFGRTGLYGGDFNRGRVDAHRLGSRYGYGIQETYQAEDALLRGGVDPRKGLAPIQADTDALMRFSKVYGLSPSSIGGDYADTMRRGAFSQGEGQEYANLLASSIKANRMTGREQEQVQALNELVDVFTSGKVSVESEDFKYIAAIQTELGKRNEALKGERGANVLRQFGSVFNPQDDLLVRMIAIGGGFGLGPEGLLQAKEAAYKGASDPEAMAALMSGAKAYGVGLDTTIGQHYFSDKMHLPPSAVGELASIFERDGSVAASQYYQDVSSGGDMDSLYGNIENTKALNQERAKVNRENARVAGGDKLNSLLNPFRKVFNALPTGVQTGIGFGSVAAPMYFGAKLLPNVLKSVFTGAGGQVSGVSGAVKGLSGLFTGAGAGLGKFAPVLGKMGAGISKAAPIVGKVAPYAGVAFSGIDAIGAFKEGDTRRGVQALSGGAGGLAGAKIGALAGTAIGGPIGTVIGGLAGYFGGETLFKYLGGKGYDLATKQKNQAVGNGTALSTPYVPYGPRGGQDNQGIAEKSPQVYECEQNLLNRKDELLDKEEKLVNRLFAGTEPGGMTSEATTRALRQEQEQQKKRSPLSNIFQTVGDAAEMVTGAINGNVGGILSSVSGLLGGSTPSSGGLLSNMGQRLKRSALKSSLDPATEKEIDRILSGLPQNQQAFMKSMIPGAIDNYKNFGIFPSVMMGQAIIESGWGASGLTADYNNYFGIKADSSWSGPKVTLMTTEYQNGKAVRVPADFRAYNDPSDSIRDHGKFLTENPRYAQAGVFQAQNAQQQLEAIKRAGYATDPNYAGVVSSAIRSGRADQIEQLLLRGLQNPGMPSYAVGIDRVGRDQVAYLHKDEAVLNRHDAKDYREGRIRRVGTGFMDAETTVSENLSSTQNPSVVNLTVNLTAGNSDAELVQKLSSMIDQAIEMAQQQNRGVALNKSFVRVPV